MTTPPAPVAAGVIEIFVPGALRNPLNGTFSRAHWGTRSKWANEWKRKTWAALAGAQIVDAIPAVHPGRALERKLPKRITFTAQTGATWDDDSIPAGCKPIRDALIGYVIHSDAPDSGHQFVYEQRINRKQRGVRITITQRDS